jgi:hypothetical protein
MSEGFVQYRDAVAGLAAAAVQVGRTGTEAQRAKAVEILSDARKKIYAVLSEG